MVARFSSDQTTKINQIRLLSVSQLLQTGNFIHLAKLINSQTIRIGGGGRSISWRFPSVLHHLGVRYPAHTYAVLVFFLSDNTLTSPDYLKLTTITD